MTDRPILRFLEPTDAARRKRKPSGRKKPATPGRARQGQRLGSVFQRLQTAYEMETPGVELRADPLGIAPERALVFETAAPIQDFSKAAREAGLEVLAEIELDDLADADGAFAPEEGDERVQPVLYATMPSDDALQRLLRYWRAYQRGDVAPTGLTPWWNLFDLLHALRTWGPDDRFTLNARAEILDRLPPDDDEEVFLELEIWPSIRDDQRNVWREEAEAKVIELGGRIVDRAAIAGDGFVYAALLVALATGQVRAMIDNPFEIDGIASIEGLQFILPQTIAQGAPTDGEDIAEAGAPAGLAPFDPELPARVVLIDGVPAAAHPALDGGVVIEDVHDLVGRSQVNKRYHASAMASLILRGDLEADGGPLWDSRLISIPVLIDGDNGSVSPNDRLFVDILHVALTRAFVGENRLAPDAFVVNISIGVRHMQFANRISALARLMDWWAWKAGVLFVVSAGNMSEELNIAGVDAISFENASIADRQKLVRDALASQAFERSLLAPAECLNAVTVGAISHDHAPQVAPPLAGVLRIENDGETLPQITSAVGLGPLKAIKPDLLTSGGAHEVRAVPRGDDSSLRVVAQGQRTGLVTAAPMGGTTRSSGTSDATALATRSILQAAAALVQDGGPYAGQEMPRRDLALLTRALAVNAANWPQDTRNFYDDALARRGASKYAAAKMDVARYFGHGALDPARMVDCPGHGVTFVGLGDIRKDGGKVFEVFLPPSLAGQKLPRSMRVTLAWFSPVDPVRASYRLAKLTAIASAAGEAEKDGGWGLNLKGDGPDTNMVARGTVWSQRLVANQKHAPKYGGNAFIPIRVQCQEASSRALSPDDDIRFAIAVSLEVEAEVEFDVREEVRQAIQVKLQGGSL